MAWCKLLAMSDDMKDLMNRVTEAKKAAKANLIGRGKCTNEFQGGRA